MKIEMNATDDKLSCKPLLEQGCDFPPLPEVAWKVLEMTSDVYCGTQALEEIISRDQALTARLLRIANSAFLGVRGEVVTVGKAASVLGSQRLRSIVVAASLDGIFKKTPTGRLQWEHSLAVALACHQLAKDNRYSDPDEAFVAGLMHDIGKNILDGQHPDSYGQVLELIAEGGQTTLKAERYILGYDHCEAGTLLANVWNWCERLTEVVRLHHTPEEAVVDPSLCHIVHFADSVVVKMGIGPISRPDLSLLDSPSLGILKLTAEQVEQLSEQIPTKLADEKKTFRLP